MCRGSTHRLMFVKAGQFKITLLIHSRNHVYLSLSFSQTTFLLSFTYIKIQTIKCHEGLLKVAELLHYGRTASLTSSSFYFCPFLCPSFVCFLIFFSHTSGCQCHSSGPDQTISATTGWIAMRFGTDTPSIQIMNPDDVMPLELLWGCDFQVNLST